MKQPSKKDVEREITLTGLYSSNTFSKDLSSTFIPIHFGVAMFCLGSAGASFFEGYNVYNILDSYSRICIHYTVNRQEKMKQLRLYCELFTGKYIKTFIRSLRTS